MEFKQEEFEHLVLASSNLKAFLIQLRKKTVETEITLNPPPAPVTSTEKFLKHLNDYLQDVTPAKERVLAMAREELKQVLQVGRAMASLFKVPEGYNHKVVGFGVVGGVLSLLQRQQASVADPEVAMALDA